MSLVLAPYFQSLHPREQARRAGVRHPLARPPLRRLRTRVPPRGPRTGEVNRNNMNCILYLKLSSQNQI